MTPSHAVWCLVCLNNIFFLDLSMWLGIGRLSQRTERALFQSGWFIIFGYVLPFFTHIFIFCMFFSLPFPSSFLSQLYLIIFCSCFPFIYLVWLVHSCWRTWIRPRLRSCVTTLASASWRGVLWSLYQSLDPVSGTSVCPPTPPFAQRASMASCNQRWVHQPVYFSSTVDYCWVDIISSTVSDHPHRSCRFKATVLFLCHWLCYKFPLCCKHTEINLL